MSMRLANNVGSLTAQRNLGRSTSAMNRSLERLSSGFKVNRGADGPAALVISEKLRAQVAGLNQAIENSEKAVSVVQTAEGALNEINSLLVKVRSLALDSANSGVNDADALAANQAEINNVLETIDRIANNTQFSTKKLLNGESGVTGTTNDTDVTFLRATADTQENTYSISVSQAGGRATRDAATVQTAATTADEILTVNGVAITIASGSDQTAVIDRVNEFTSQTGVVADDQGAGGATRFYSLNFGEDASITVVSDTAAGVDTTGVGTTALVDSGENIEVDITPAGGSATTYIGSGNLLEVDSGVAKGLLLQFAADTDHSRGHHQHRDRWPRHRADRQQLTGVPDRSEPESDGGNCHQQGNRRLPGARTDRKCVFQPEPDQRRVSRELRKTLWPLSMPPLTRSPICVVLWVPSSKTRWSPRQPTCARRWRTP